MDALGVAAALAVVAFVGGVALAARSSRRLLSVVTRNGRLVRARGRAPRELVHDIEEILERDRATGSVLVVIEGDAAAVRASETIASGTAQRLRNAVGRFPLARIRTGPRVRRP